MGRRLKRRSSFYEDAQALLRMGQAIFNDVELPESWRRDMDARIKELASDLLRAPPKHVIIEGSSRAPKLKSQPPDNADGVSASGDDLDNANDVSDDFSNLPPDKMAANGD